MLVLFSHRAAAGARAQIVAPRPRVVVIGNFDGVHCGHQALIRRARQLLPASTAGAATGSVVVLTFSPHPARLLAPQLAPPLLTSAVRKRELLAAQGVDALVEQPFDRAFSQLSPPEFVDQILLGTALEGLGAGAVVVGYDFTFGRGRAGTTGVLADLLGRAGVAVNVVEAVDVPGPDGAPLLCSSTAVRQAIQGGQIERAAALLGREPELEGEVVHGAGRGRSIGVPTANVRPTSEVLPAVGVYAAWAELLAPEAALAPAGSGTDPAQADDSLQIQPRAVLLRCPAAVNVGYNPTFTSARGDSPVSEPVPSGSIPAPAQLPAVPLSALSVEAHLLREPGDPPLPPLYGQTLRLRFVSRVRSEQKFPSVAALVEQIGKDIGVVADRLGTKR
jgi:riboflavin kinase/FMN adenylyltransferase